MDIETPGRKLARFVYWNQFRNGNNIDKRFVEGKHLLVGTNEGQELTSPFGFGARHIIAVESDPNAAVLAHEMNSLAKVICGDPVKISKEYRRTLSSALFELRDPINEDVVAMIAQVVMHGLKDESFLGVSMRHHANDLLSTPRQADIENLDDRDILFVLLEQVKKLPDKAKVIRALLTTGTDKERKDAADRYRKTYVLHQDVSTSRVSSLLFRLQDELNACRTVIAPTLFVHYDKASSYAFMRVLRLPRNSSIDSCERQKYTFMVENLTEIVSHKHLTMDALRLEVVSWLMFLTEKYNNGTMSEEDNNAMIDATPQMFNLGKELVYKWINLPSELR